MNRRVLHPVAMAREAARKDAKQAHQASEAYRSGKKSNRKGKRREREAAKLLGGVRVPMSGALDGHPNDVILPNGWRTEVKARRSGCAFLYRWLEESDVVAFRDPDGSWLYAMTMPQFRLWLGARSTPAVPLPPGPDPALLPGGARLIFRERRNGFQSIRRWLAAEQADALLFKADRQEWLVVMDGEHLHRLLRGDKDKTLHV